MEDFQSKYRGEEVDRLLDRVANNEVGSQLTESDIADMGFTKNQGTITEVKMNGTSKGTSGVVDLGTVITSHQDISGKVDKVDGKQLSTEDFTTILKQKLDGLSNYDDTTISQAVEKLRADLDALVSGDTTTAIKRFSEVIAFLDGIQDSQNLSSIIASIEQQIAGKMDNVTLAKVATSGNYNDLSNKPTIPSAVTESTVSGWGFTKNTGTYSKPSTGIPKTDLASAVQTSLGKADSALQEIPSDVVRSSKIKTINGESIIGSGNIEISGGGGSSGGGSAYPVVYHYPSEKLATIAPNTFHIWSSVSDNLTIRLGAEIEGVANEYLFQFQTTSNASLTLQGAISWGNDDIPTIVAGRIYQISILKNIAIYTSISSNLSTDPA